MFFSLLQLPGVLVARRNMRGRSEAGLIFSDIAEIRTLLEIKWYCFVKQQDNNNENHILHSGEFGWN